MDPDTTFMERHACIIIAITGITGMAIIVDMYVFPWWHHVIASIR